MKKIYLLLLIPFLFGFTGVFSGIIGTPCTPQTISFTQPADMTVGDADQTLTYSASSGLTVSLDTNNHSYCTIVSNKLHAVAVSGTNGCTAKATQTGNSTYCAATEVDKSVTISQPLVTFYAGTNHTSEWTYGDGYLPTGQGWGSMVTIGSTGGNITSYGVKFNDESIGYSMKVALYQDTAGSPTTLLDTFTTTTVLGWNMKSGLSIPISANGSVWVMAHHNETGDVVIMAKADITSHGWERVLTYAAFPTNPALGDIVDVQIAARITVQY